MNYLKHAARLLAPLTAVVGAACGSGCSDANCADFLEVRVDGAEEFSVTLAAPGGESMTAVCPGVCFDVDGVKAVVFNGAPAEALVVVQDASGKELNRVVVRPSYEDQNPNGVTCPPTCRGGLVTIPVSLSCDDATCVDFLQLRLEGGVPETFNARVELPNDTLLVACPGSCFTLDGARVLQLEGSPPTLTVVLLTSEGGEIGRRTVSPEYEQFRPNGPSCLPACQSASVTLTF